MSTQNPQTERETVDEALTVFTRQDYIDNLSNLTWEELKQECARQFDLSGDCLDKYRRETQRTADARKEATAQRRRAAMWNSAAIGALATLHIAWTAIQSMIDISNTSSGYTQNAKVIAVRLVTDIGKSALSIVSERVSELEKKKSTDPEDWSDIPF
jgi:hypothetical protein